MARKAHPPESAPREPDDLDRLERTVKELVGQVRTLSLIMDEIRDELIYAVRNDRFNAIPDATWKQPEAAPHVDSAPSIPCQPGAEMPAAARTPPVSTARDRTGMLFG